MFEEKKNLGQAGKTFSHTQKKEKKIASVIDLTPSFIPESELFKPKYFSSIHLLDAHCCV